MEYCCHVWAGTPSCYLELLGKLQKWICRTFGASLAALLEPLAHHGNEASLSLFYRYYFGDVHLNWLNWLHFLHWFHDFSVTIPRWYKDVYVNSFFPCTGRLWNSLPIECFPLTYDLNGFKSKIKSNKWISKEITLNTANFW